MDETSRMAIDVLRSDENLAWVAEQLISTFSEGIAQSAKELGGMVEGNVVGLEPISKRERTKRDKYETSRPYDENEKLELVKFALGEAFVTTLSMQNSSTRNLKDLGSTATEIEFSAPDEEDGGERSYTRALSDRSAAVEVLRRRVDEFDRKLIP